MALVSRKNVRESDPKNEKDLPVPIFHFLCRAHAEGVCCGQASMRLRANDSFSGLPQPFCVGTRCGDTSVRLRAMKPSGLHKLLLFLYSSSLQLYHNL